jgi:SAM-dependent methyltransferase
MNESNLQALLEEWISNETLLQGVLSSPRDKASPQKITLRPITIKSQKVYQLSLQHAQKVVHENIYSKNIVGALLKILPQYKQALFCTSAGDFHILFNKKGEATVLRKPPSKTELQVLSHNRPKNYLLKEGTPIPFLVELGVMSPSGKVHADKRDKFRQINRFLEMIDDILPHLPKDKTLRIVDFGCGKAYLTFALYHLLHIEKKYDLEIIGLDLKEDVVSFCQNVAKKLGFSHLRFIQGDIQSFSEEEEVDLVVCLHACDTATDEALAKAVEWNAQVILAVPCCQHELFKQVKCESLSPLLSHGILKERFAALVTDAARAQFLEILGYKTQVLEFIDLEHTPKNLLIRAVRQKRKVNQSELIANYKNFKELLHINPKIEKIFVEEINS